MLNDVLAESEALRVRRIYDRLVELGALPTLMRLAHEYRVPARLILARDNRPEVVSARHHVWTVVAHTLCLGADRRSCIGRTARVEGWSPLSRLFEVDHTTIMVAVKAHEARLLEEHRRSA